MPYQPSSLHSNIPCFRWMAVAILLMVFTGCGNKERSKLVGTWVLEHVAKVEKRVAEDDFKSDSTMELEFRAGGGLVTTTKTGAIDGQKRGRWEFVSFDKSSKRMMIRCVLSNQESEHEVEFLANDQIKVVPPNMAGLDLKLQFRRQ